MKNNTKTMRREIMEFCREQCDSFYLVGIHRCSCGHCGNCSVCDVLSELLIRLKITNEELTNEK